MTKRDRLSKGGTTENFKNNEDASGNESDSILGEVDSKKQRIQEDEQSRRTGLPRRLRRGLPGKPGRLLMPSRVGRWLEMTRRL